ncbi:MAG: hypothetical protein GX111_05350 [Clostridiales bacterium]|nr:hypothetical protein [Clostridiales bacterium]
MKAIKRKSFIFAAFTGFFMLTGFMLPIFGGGVSETRTRIIFLCVVIASIVLAGFLIREYRKLKIARLIAENPILHIRTAVISEISAESMLPVNTDSTEVIVSYFGILLGEKIIKFNQNDIRLRAVEIGKDFISITCGKFLRAQKRTQFRMQNIRLLRPAIDSETMKDITEKFRFETGVTPILLP